MLICLFIIITIGRGTGSAKSGCGLDTVSFIGAVGFVIFVVAVVAVTAVIASRCKNAASVRRSTIGGTSGGDTRIRR